MTVLVQLAAAGPFDSSAAYPFYVLSRAADYIGTGLFLGGLAFIAAIWPEGGYHPVARRVLTAGWLTGLVATLAAIDLEGAWAAGRPSGALFDWGLFMQVLDLRFGTVWLARALFWLLATVLLAWLLQRGPQAAVSFPWRVSVIAVGVGLLRTSGLTGHASDAPMSALAQIADLAHIGGMALWFGGLVMMLLAVLPRRDPVELAEVVPRYSTLAMGCVVAIVLGGAVLAWQVLGSPEHLFDTSYGQLLMIKLGLFAGVMAVAQLSKNWVARRLDFAVILRGDVVTVRPFVYSVTAEAVLVVLVLFVASFLVTAAPGR